LGGSIDDMLQITTGTVNTLPELFSFAKQIPSLARRLDASFTEFGGVEGEKLVPRRQFAGMLVHITTDQGKEGLDVGNKWRWGRHRGRRSILVETSSALNAESEWLDKSRRQSTQI
jgi:hypothetical protein